MNLEEQLKKLFPDHQPQEETSTLEKSDVEYWVGDEVLECKFEKRNGKINTIIAGYNGAKEDFKKLAKDLKKDLSVGGSIKNEEIIIQGDYRDEIMEKLKQMGFKVKRVGG